MMRVGSSKKNSSKNFTENVTEKIRLHSIIESIKNNASITSESLAQQLGVDKRTIIRDFKKLQAQGKVCRIGPNKGGNREVVQ